MKKTLAAIAMALALPTLAAANDINPGAMQLSGKSAFDWGSSTFKTDAEKVETSKLGGNLSAMYYASKFLAFGLATEYDATDTTTTIGGVDTEKKEGIFYFGPKVGLDYELMRHFSVFADATIGMTQITIEKDAGTGVGFEIGAGFKIFLNQNVSLDVGGMYRTLNADVANVGKVSNNGFGATIGFSLYLTNNPVNSDYAH